MIKNITKNNTLTESYQACRNAFSKSFGLMFRLRSKPLIFYFDSERIIPLHMVFVFFPIDVLFLDPKKKVVETKENFRPFTFYTPKKKAMYVIELPVGMINEKNVSLGDSLEF